MLTIRLSRVGRKNDPSFRVIVVDSKKKPKTGNYQEMVGSYDPRSDRVELKAERIKHWISNGAQVSDTVHNLLVSQKIIDAKKINVLPRKSPPKKEEEEAAAAPAEAAATEVAPAEDIAPAAADEPKEEQKAEATTAADDTKGDNAVAPTA